MDTPKLTSPSVLKQLLNHHDIHLSKRYGQNFLCDEHIVNRIADAAPSDIGVLEIGPGVGTLTIALAQRVKRLVAVEIDDRLIPILKQHLSSFDHASLIHSDILKVNLDEVANQIGTPFSAIGNLPYQITSPLLGMMVEHRHLIRECVFMVQRELADKMLAPVGSGKGSALGVFINAFADAERLFNVPKTVFFPRPKVDSSVFRIQFSSEPKFQADEAMFFNVVRAAFNLRRKTLRQALRQSPLINANGDQVDTVLEQSGIDPKRRGETLTLEEFDQLASLF
jgi:16S rRNA (adenine1518-N6/adenine1519-N6)-dimethyltransferase